MLKELLRDADSADSFVKLIMRGDPIGNPLDRETARKVGRMLLRAYSHWEGTKAYEELKNEVKQERHIIPLSNEQMKKFNKEFLGNEDGVKLFDDTERLGIE